MGRLVVIQPSAADTFWDDDMTNRWYDALFIMILAYWCRVAAHRDVADDSIDAELYRFALMALIQYKLSAGGNQKCPESQSDGAAGEHHFVAACLIQNASLNISWCAYLLIYTSALNWLPAAAVVMLNDKVAEGIEMMWISGWLLLISATSLARFFTSLP